ncbi:MAG TPA: DUF6587 family protein [Variovorax sp.]|nr:DUF6587 family protein [Variovorax sp.]
MLEHVIVALIVAVAALSLAWRWMPALWRRALAAKLAAGSHRAGLVDAQQAQQMAATMAKKSGCGACDSCLPACASGDKTQGTKAGATDAPLIRQR